MKRVLALLVLMPIFVIGAVPMAAYAQEPPPATPTLAPVVGPEPSATQTLQLQEFARESAYLVGQTTVYTTTVGGATWAVERRFTYGEAGITIVGMALALLFVLDLAYRVVTGVR